MKIFEENGKIRLQLMEMAKGIMLFDFTIEKDSFNELRNHIIGHLNEFSQKETLKKENIERTERILKYGNKTLRNSEINTDLIKIHIFMCHLIQHGLTPGIKIELEEYIKSWSLMLEV